MRVECASCNKIYNIPDERLPKGKKIVFPCPSCRSAIHLDLRINLSQTREEDTPSGTEQPEDKGDAIKKKILRALKDLPPMPQVVLKAQQVMADPGSSFKELGAIIETDQAIAARVLKLANSAYYGLRGMVSSIHQATVVLGYEALGELITVVGAAGLIDNILTGYRLESGFLWQHSLAVAFGSKIIAQKRYPRLENDAFSAGLLHDAGKIVMDPFVQEKEADFDKIMEDGKTTFLSAEQKILGFDHAEITYEICQKWGIPDSQSLAIKFHHYPSRSEGNELAYILHLADLIAMQGGIGTGFDAMLYQAEAGALEFLRLDQSDCDSISQQVHESVDKITSDIHTEKG
ncbi:MAG: HDOD domain-containing protein [Thermodesulfobacteriota bacterium]